MGKKGNCALLRGGGNGILERKGKEWVDEGREKKRKKEKGKKEKRKRKKGKKVRSRLISKGG